MKEPDASMESRLVPIMREAVETVRMIAFLELRRYAAGRHPEADRTFHGRLAGAAVNELFGTPNPALAGFAGEHAAEIHALLEAVAVELSEMRIPLTDALRMSVLCDHYEGADNREILSRARELDILLVERDMPLPHHFIELVRRLGAHYQLLQPPAGE